MMSYIMLFLILLSVITAGFTGRMPQLSSSILQGATDAVDLLLVIGGNVIFWSGFMKIADKSGITEFLGRAVAPVFHKTLFKGLKRSSHALHLISLNFAANLLGLGNAAMPLGISAMQELEKEQHTTDTASDEMIMFVVMNTASLQIIPTTAIMLRTKFGSANPVEILAPVGIASAAALFAGLFVATLLCRAKAPRLNYAKPRKTNLLDST